jgi:hypothetical protein
MFKVTLLLAAAATLIGCAAIQPESPQLGRSLDDVRQRHLEHVPAATTTRGSLDTTRCPGFRYPGLGSPTSPYCPGLGPWR